MGGRGPEDLQILITSAWEFVLEVVIYSYDKLELLRYSHRNQPTILNAICGYFQYIALISCVYKWLVENLAATCIVHVVFKCLRVVLKCLFFKLLSRSHDKHWTFLVLKF